MKSFLIRLFVLLSILAVVGVVVLVSGIVPIKASSGHWPITKWMLSFASSRSIATHSAPIEVPDLDEPGIVRLGAAVYESNCLWCHGRPSMPAPPAVAGMTPPPPYLPPVIDEWEDDELFYIVKHGIKFAGMPAWPAKERDNEIWPVVAFLRAFPKMSAADYQQLLAVPENDDAPEVVVEACAVCHGLEGSEIISPRVPVLAGQNRIYLIETLQAYASGNRHSGIMQPIAARLGDEEIALIAKWYASQTAPSETLGASQAVSLISAEKSGSTRDPEATEDNSLIAAKEKKTVACQECHGVNNDPAYPVLRGQPELYLFQQLELLKSRRRGGTGKQELMHPIVDAMSEQEMRRAAMEVSSGR